MRLKSLKKKKNLQRDLRKSNPLCHAQRERDHKQNFRVVGSARVGGWGKWEGGRWEKSAGGFHLCAHSCFTFRN